MIRSFLTGGAEHPRERVKDLLLDDHLECGCLGSVGGEGEGAEDDVDDNEDAGSQRQLFDFFLGLTLGRSFSSLISMLTWVFNQGTCVSCVLSLSLLVRFYRNKVRIAQ